MPPGLPADHQARDGFDDQSIAVPREAGSVWFRVWVPGDRFVAAATFAAGDQTVQCDGIDVEAIYRRQGIATALYELASSIFAAPVIPSATQTSDAKAFWGDRSEIRT